ncbi:MAG TPA: universal stress protein [Polyangia bacterium]
MIDHVLIPTDFSETAAAAAEYGCALAARLGARVTLLNVFSAGVVALPDAVYAPTDEELEMLAHAARSHLAAIAERLARDGLHIDVVAVEGVPSEAIADWARQHDAGLIVIGTHGRRGLAHALLGSVAERVVRTAHCPVMTYGRAAHHAADAAKSA